MNSSPALKQGLSTGWPDWACNFMHLREVIDGWSHRRPQAIALSDERGQRTWAEFHRQVHAAAAALQAQGVKKGDAVAMIGRCDAAQLIAYVSTVLAGAVAVPLPTSATPDQWTRMLQNCRARWVFADSELALDRLDLALDLVEITTDRAFRHHGRAWGTEAALAHEVLTRPEDPFNIIYSSGTTGHPKGIVQSHGMRWMHMRRGERYGLSAVSTMLIATPLYSNTTLVAVLPALAAGGRVHLMSKFSAQAYLDLAQSLGVTHTMLVPVQYQRLMACQGFDHCDLSTFVMKLCTSAPFSAGLKAEVVDRWPGGLIEIYGMTEGGGTFLLDCHLHGDKLHTVGRPTPGHRICLLDEVGNELAPSPGVVGEVAGHSLSMMTMYLDNPEQTAQAQWFDSEGRRYIRTGDLASFDAEGFLQLRGRRKDMIISGGFNIYPIDLENVLQGHPDVVSCAVIGVPSIEWGETPVAYVVLAGGSQQGEQELMRWFAAQVGRTQRLAALYLIDELPRNAIGKVDKNELRSRFARSQGEN